MLLGLSKVYSICVNRVLWHACVHLRLEESLAQCAAPLHEQACH